jgi:type IV pilus assembly protein PilW
MAGFGMVEILVGLVIGMLASLAVLQLFTYSEGRNRTASGSADAQSTGAITLYQLQTNIQRAGFGLSSIALLNCGSTWTAVSGAISKNPRLAPVSVNPTAADGSALIPAGDANTDVIMLMYGNGDSMPQGSEVDPLNSTGNLYTLVSTPSAFAQGDRVIAATGNTADSCGANILPIDRVTNVPATNVTTAVGGSGLTLYNLGPGPNSANTNPTATMPTNGPTILVYAVRSGVLTVCDFNINDCSLAGSSLTNPAIWVPLAGNVVSLRAVYWKDNSGALWNGSIPANDQTQPANACAWARVWAVNVMLVTRSDERDKEIVTRSAGTVVSGNATLAAMATSSALAPTWSDATLDAAAPVVLGTDDATDREWRHYRYKPFRALVPIRNTTWLVPQLLSSVPPMC